jgi:hypothetical protein
MNTKYALITGATAGIGLDIAKELASQGNNIILTARREDRLQEISIFLREEFNIQCDYVVADLAQSSAPEKIFNFCLDNNYVVEILINNAGYSINKKFHETGEDEEEKFLRVLGIAVVALTKIHSKHAGATAWKNYDGIFSCCFCATLIRMGRSLWSC